MKILTLISVMVLGASGQTCIGASEPEYDNFAAGRFTGATAYCDSKISVTYYADSNRILIQSFNAGFTAIVEVNGYVNGTPLYKDNKFWINNWDSCAITLDLAGPLDARSIRCWKV